MLHEDVVMFDHHDFRPELPDEAGASNGSQFDPDDQWLRKAPRELQIEAMRLWFCSRYQDPANDTPYNGREGGYLFIHGGPYDPNEEIQDRFSDIVEFDVIEELVQHLHAEVGDEWAPIEHDYRDWEYDEALSLLDEEDTPYKTLKNKLSQVEEILKADGESSIKTLITQLAHGAAIAALEAYLLELTVWHALNDENSLRAFVSKNTDSKLGAGTLKLSAIFDRMDGLKKQVFSYLQTYIWHRLEDVKDIFEDSFDVTFPKTGELMGDILLRHDIVHRGGKNKKGELVNVSPEDVQNVTERIRVFATALEAEFTAKDLADF